MAKSCGLSGSTITPALEPGCIRAMCIAATTWSQVTM